MPLTEEAFTTLVDAGCLDCRSRKLSVEALVLQKLPLLAGELYGSPSWGYKGEDFVRGTYRIACDACKKELYAASSCPLCDAEGGVERALAHGSAFLLPAKCGACESELLSATAYVPARVAYDGTRGSKPRAQAEPDEEGFHALRTECKKCHAVVEHRGACGLCGGG
jgi:hypothetical protein